MRLHITLRSALTFGALACSDQLQPTAPGPLVSSSVQRAAAPTATGAVYTMTNAPSGNAVLTFRRSADGTLTPLGGTATGGRGTGGAVDPLMSEYSVLLTTDHALLFVVNAGSNDLSSFIVGADGSLTLADRASSAGAKPVSLALYGRILYVLNTGDNTLSGFRVSPHGKLQRIERSTRDLQPGAAGASTIAFTPDGRWLIVTEIMANRIETFPVTADGRLGESRLTPSSGMGPFGFDVTAGNRPIITEAMGAAPNGAVSSYRFAESGTLAVVTPSLSTTQQATCWIVLTADDHHAFVSNTMSGSIAALQVADDATLTLLAPRAGESGDGSAPIDLDLSSGGQYLYVLEAGTGTIGAFAVGSDGTLSARPDTPAGAPASGMQGLAAW